MKNIFKIIFFGIKVGFISSDKFFKNLFEEKFLGFKKFNTYNFEDRNLQIIFKKNKPFFIKNSLTKISSQIYFNQNIFLIYHEYLSTKTEIKFKIKNENILKIELNFHSNIFFDFINLIFFNKIKRQLFQQLIKLYIEQSMLWQITNSKGLECLHASAVINKDNSVDIFCGLNGVGKSTLVQKIIKNKEAKPYSDNYILIDNKYAYFYPDATRLDKESIAYLSIKKYKDFGFKKYIIENEDHKVDKRALISSISLVHLGVKFVKTKCNVSLLDKIIKYQIINQEHIKYAPISYIGKSNRYNPNYPSCDFYKLTIKKLY